jgi:hypothetical protein
VRFVDHASLLAMVAHCHFVVKKLRMSMLVLGTPAPMLATLPSSQASALGI